MARLRTRGPHSKVEGYGETQNVILDHRRHSVAPRQWRVKYPPRWTQPEVPRLVPSSTAQRSMSAGAELRPTTDSSVFLLKVGQYGLVTIGIILLLTFAVLLCRRRPDHFMVGHAEAHFFKQGHRGGILVRRHQPKLVDALVSGPAAGVF